MKIREEMDQLFRFRDDILVDIKKQQEICPHETSVCKAEGSTGNWDRDDSYWFVFYCYDCRKRWSHDQKLGHGKSIRVDNIEYDKNPEIVELEIKIASMK